MCTSEFLTVMVQKLEIFCQILFLSPCRVDGNNEGLITAKHY